MYTQATQGPFTIIADGSAFSALDTDCNCACAHTQPQASTAPPHASTLLETHPDLQRIPLDQEHAVVFVPSLSRVTVVNAATELLLEHLRTPRRFGALTHREGQAAAELHALGLLRPVGAADLPPPPPDELVVWLHTTNACTLRCTYCYLDKTDEAMSEATADATIETVLSAARRHGYRRLQVKYAGAEASLNLQLIAYIHRQLVPRAADEGLTLRGVVLSNGVALTKHRLAVIQGLGLELMISLDGPAAFHDAQRPTLNGQPSYQAVVSSIERARAMRLDLIVSVTITGTSVAGLPELVAWLLTRKLRFTLNFYRENSCSADIHALQLDEQRLIAGLRAAYAMVEADLPAYSLLGALLDRVNAGSGHARTCAVGENYLVVDQHGGVARCQMLIGERVSSVWEPDPLMAIRLEPRGVQNLPVTDKVGCRSCQWRYWCAGGCPIATQRATGRYDVRSPNCMIYRTLFPEVLRLEGLRLLTSARAPGQSVDG